MERYEIKCAACRKPVGQATKENAVQVAVSHVRRVHRLVKFPHPALDLISLHPFYTLDVLSQQDVSIQHASEQDETKTNAPPEDPAGENGNGETPAPPTNEN